MDTGTRSRNHVLLLCGLAIAWFLCAIPMHWYRTAGLSFSMIFGGQNGELLWGLPIWFLLVSSILFTLVAVTNLLQLTRVPRILPMLALMFLGIVYVTPLTQQSPQFTVYPGPVVALLATVIACMAVHFSPLEPPA